MAELTVLCDPTDWKSTKLPFVGALDAALRCEICKDFYTAPVITNCCHTFCSLCIRRALHADGICPICRTAEQEYRLRKNTTVQDLLDAFEACRAQLYEFATREPEAGALPEGGMPAGAAEPSSHSPRRSQRRAVALRTRPNLRADGNDDDGDGEYAPGAPSPSPSPSPSPPPPGIHAGCPASRTSHMLTAGRPSRLSHMQAPYKGGFHKFARRQVPVSSVVTAPASYSCCLASPSSCSQTSLQVGNPTPPPPPESQP